MPKGAYGKPETPARAQANSQRGLRRRAKAGRSPGRRSGPDWLCRNGHEDRGQTEQRVAQDRNK